jgi:hypothetical protein
MKARYTAYGPTPWVKWLRRLLVLALCWAVFLARLKESHVLPWLELAAFCA